MKKIISLDHNDAGRLYKIVPDQSGASTEWLLVFLYLVFDIHEWRYS